jgi:hypothetical protein
MAALKWTDVASGALAIAQLIAILVAGGWAYFKFVRGRTFAERLETSVTATPFDQDGIRMLCIRATISNTGASQVDLIDDLKIVRVYGTKVADAQAGVNVDWGHHLILTPIFGEHKWIEAQETVSDEALAVVANCRLAYRVELLVASKKKKQWSTAAVVPNRGRE